uniref:Uncharacterized protein n=1 Tax=Wuchereria bancrofti TaxID=6293 RepID=A0A1I8EK02_WUCBA
MKVQVLFQAAALIILVLNVKICDPASYHSEYYDEIARLRCMCEAIKRCAIITEEYKRLIQESKRSAFQNCFTKQM